MTRLRFVAVLLILMPAFGILPAQTPIRWAFTDYPPANYVEEDGQFSGYLYDITVEALTNRLGIPVESAVLPWSRCQHMVEQGSFDMILTVPTEERLEYTVATKQPVWVKVRRVYTYSDNPRQGEFASIRSLEDIREMGLTVVSYLGNGWAESILEEMRIPVIYASSVESMYRMLSEGRGDIIVEDQSIAEENIQNLGLGCSVSVSDGIAARSGFHIMIGRNSEFFSVMNSLDSALDEMWADGTIERILAEYGLPAVR